MTAVLPLANPTTVTVSVSRDATGLHIRSMHAALCTSTPIPAAGGAALDHHDLCGDCRTAYQEMTR